MHEAYTYKAKSRLNRRKSKWSNTNANTNEIELNSLWKMTADLIILSTEFDTNFIVKPLSYRLTDNITLSPFFCSFFTIFHFQSFLESKFSSILRYLSHRKKIYKKHSWISHMDWNVLTTAKLFYFKIYSRSFCTVPFGLTT